MKHVTLYTLMFLLALPIACLRAKEAPSEEVMDRMEREPAPVMKAEAKRPPSPRRSRRSKARKKKISQALKEKGIASLLGSAGPGSGSLGDALGGIAMPEADEAPEPEPEAAAATRSWFPETFLFEPLVKTDAKGHALVPVKVPDRLTSWRVLALAHSREGAQAGTVTTFLGTLPTYVDPIVPSFLMTKDAVQIPIQVVNTTDKQVTRTLRVVASGAAKVNATGPVVIPPNGSIVRSIPLKANRPGTVDLRASLGDRDAVERSFEVLPTGRPLTENRGGTLASPREIVMTLPDDTDPMSVNARLLVFPGALSILRSELHTAVHRSGASGSAYALLLAGKAPELLRALGGEVNKEAMRKMSIVAGQRVIQTARSPDAATATILLEGALAHPNNPVLSRLAERLAAQVAREQRPDGTFQGGRGWTLQRLLVTTADSLRAVRTAQETSRAKQRALGATLRANGAFERNIGRVEDPYTAAAILASGAVEGTLADRLVKRVKKSIKQNEDGSRVLEIPTGVVRADGRRPTTVEGTALAVLALAKDPEAKKVVMDLGATLLGRYRPGSGWGDGYENLMALRAVLEIFKEPLPKKVHVTLALDGRNVAEGALAGERLKDMLAIATNVRGALGKHTWTVKAEPAVPGLGFSLAVKHYVPWKLVDAKGLELSVDVGKNAEVGRPVDVTLSAVSPAGMALTIRQALPAGIGPDMRSLDQLVSAGTITSHEVEDGAITFEAPARQPGQTFVARYRVIPTLRGTLHTSASSIAPSDRPQDAFFVPPSVWKIK